MLTKVIGAWNGTEWPTSLRDFLTSPTHSQGYTLGLEWATPVGPAPNLLRFQAEHTYLERSPSYAKAFFNRGTAYALLGQRAVAQAEWATAVAFESDPWTRSAMQRSAGLGPAPAIVSVVTPDSPPPNVTSAPAPGTGPGTVPIARTPSPVKAVPPVPPAGLPQVLVTGSVAPSASPQALDARALASRAVTRELDGDHAGAMQDLKTALTLEPDAARRAGIANLLRLLDTPR